MATIGLWKVESRLDKVIKYVSNEEKTINEDFIKDLHRVIDYTIDDYKTEEQYFVSGINCGVETAYQEMCGTKKEFSKTGGILAFHGFQSFKEGEVTPELAHEIGVKLAEELWGDRFEVIVSTHVNTNHIHNHFVINSVSFRDGKRYYDKRSTYAEIRHVSDCLCAEYGLSVLEEKPCRNSKINYANYYKGVAVRSTYHSTTKEDIDRAIAQAYDYKDFLNLMRALNYEVINRYGKLSVKRPPYKRNIRIERSFGEGYSISNIQSRIENEHMPRTPFPEAKGVFKMFVNRPEHKNKKVGGIYGLFLYYCYLLGKFPKEYPNKRLPPSIRADVKKMEQISEETKLLVSQKIETYQQFLEYKNAIESRYEELMGKKELLWKKVNRSKNDNEKENIKKTIEELNMEIYSLRKEVVLCDGIEERLPIIKSKVKEIDKEDIVKEEKENEHIK